MALKDDDKRKIREYEKIHQSRVQQSTRKGHLSTSLSNLFSKMVEARRKGKGFLNKEGGLYNPHEGHAAGWGFFLIDFYFRLNWGIFLILFVAGISYMFRNPVSEERKKTKTYFKTEILNNIHYYLIFGSLSLILWTVFYGATPPPVDQGLTALLLSSALGSL